ncbi:restriction endonuclease subunit S [Xanthobacter tagetidis]|uniref:Restriction endonuclease subunit S n=1 Tax=Xanthobacter tagetidis TaxID=60216 RepID=A0A3L7AJ09_9HYPH|nr:restriction endonuclease subunit S [Xanthobacter tagetidis]MBB6306382.1 type I restriction enzyme S subunit [Xanthobacter tagetidis]RLP79638.1 restriction endonuclease subunit S [Xanthobacter tagetidis]
MSDIRWSDVAPTDWKYQKLKYVARFVGGGTPDKSTPEFWNGDIPWVSPKDMKADEIFDTEDHITVEGLQSSATNLVQPGAALIVVRSGILRHSIPVAINRVPAAINQDMRAIQPNETCDVRYLARLIIGFQAELLRLWSKAGATVESLEYDLVASTEIPVPPLAMQRRIVDFLDRETADIDALIAAKQLLLDLLAEKRRAIVAEAVMRGLNPAARLRPSGIDWLGDIPAHWEIERSRWLFTERDQRSETGEEEMLTVSHLTGVTPRSEKDVNMFEAESTTGYKLCFAGDLAINTLWAWMGAMGTARVDGIVSPAYNVYTPGSRLLPDYVDALVRIPVFAQEVTRYSKGVWSSRLRLYPEGFFETWWPVPPLAEQQEIVSHIATEAAKTDRLRTATEHSITLLKERRGALIAAAVTGQIDIPEAA